MLSNISKRIFGNEVVNNLDNVNLEQATFKNATGGFDLLISSPYTYLKNYQQINNLKHKDFDQFVYHFINYIKINHLSYDNNLKSFLYGFISSYIYDKHTNAFIESEILKEEQPQVTQAAIDNYASRYDIASLNFWASYYNLSLEDTLNYLFDTKQNDSILFWRLQNVIDYACQKTYHNHEMSFNLTYNLGKDLKFIKKHRYNVNPIKKNLYKTFDEFNQDENNKIGNLIYPDNGHKYDLYDYIPIIWENPYTKQYEKSGMCSLIRKAKFESIDIINQIEQIIKDPSKSSEEVLNVFGPISSLTGLNYNESTPLVYKKIKK